MRRGGRIALRLVNEEGPEEVGGTEEGCEKREERTDDARTGARLCFASTVAHAIKMDGDGDEDPRQDSEGFESRERLRRPRGDEQDRPENNAEGDEGLPEPRRWRCYETAHDVRVRVVSAAFSCDKLTVSSRQGDDAAERHGQKEANEDDARKDTPDAEVYVVEDRPACQDPRGVQRDAAERDESASNSLSEPSD